MRAQPAAFPPYEQYSIRQLLDAFAGGPARLRGVIDGMSEDQLRARARGSRTWSAHEICIHVADSELQGAYRMRKVFAEPGCALPGYDQDAWCERVGYHSQAASARETALEVLNGLRQLVAPILRRCSPDEWQRTGVHPDYGPVTLRNLLELYADHTERHVAQILDIRERLGFPIAFPLLLPDRLY